MPLTSIKDATDKLNTSLKLLHQFQLTELHVVPFLLFKMKKLTCDALKLKAITM